MDEDLFKVPKVLTIWNSVSCSCIVEQVLTCLVVAMVLKD